MNYQHKDHVHIDRSEYQRCVSEHRRTTIIEMGIVVLIMLCMITTCLAVAS